MMNFFKLLLASAFAAVSLAPLTVFSVSADFSNDVSQIEKPATIKILVAAKKNEIFLEAKGKHRVYNPLNGILLAEEASKTKQWVTKDSRGLYWDGLFPGIFQMRVVPSDSKTTFLVDGIEYQGCVEVYHKKGKLFVINEIDIERYLKSVMATLSFSEMDEEVMDAVVIAARTHAYYLASKKQNELWSVEAEEVGYQGHGLALQNPDIDRSINMTRHMVMLYEGMPFPATWTKDSAGKTANYSSIFQKGVKAPRGVEAPFAARDREKHAWKFHISKKDLANALGAAVIKEFRLCQDEKSHKVYAARLKDNVQDHEFDFARLQSALGMTRLRSNDFTVETNGDQFLFQGFGEGSGVGLCLLSANAMADKGSKAPKILSTFFPGTQLANVRSFGEAKAVKYLIE
jgi:SpoIID/LytB domain protein